MENNPNNRPATKTKLFVVVVIIVMIFLLSVIALVVNNHSDSQPANNVSVPAHTPDRVKANNGPNGDTVPSSSGTAPGSNNSLLSQ